MRIDLFYLDISDIQPSKLYISQTKLEKAEAVHSPFHLEKLEPIPIKRMDNKLIYTAGHTRAFLAYVNGYTKIPVYWDLDDLDWNAYRLCVGWCEEELIFKISDLKERIIDQDEYRILWLERCRKMYATSNQRYL